MSDCAIGVIKYVLTNFSPCHDDAEIDAVLGAIPFDTVGTHLAIEIENSWNKLQMLFACAPAGSVASGWLHECSSAHRRTSFLGHSRMFKPGVW